MSAKLNKITKFINEHHVLNLATSDNDEISVCALFYIYDKKTNSFVVASSEETTHIKNIKKNHNIAGSIILETDEVLKIKGLQFRGHFLELSDKKLKNRYFKRFPYSLALNPKLWNIKINYFKMTDNSFGFGKKIILSDLSP